MTHDRTWAKWRWLVAEQEFSRLGVTAFCRQRGLNRKYFHMWKRRLRLHDPLRQSKVGSLEASNEVAAVAADGSPLAVRSVAVGVRPESGKSLVVGQGLDADQLRLLLAEIEDCA